MSMLRTKTGSSRINSLDDLIFDLPLVGQHALVIATPAGAQIYSLRNIPGRDVARGQVDINEISKPGKFPPGEYKVAAYDEQTKQPIAVIDVKYQMPASPPRVAPVVVPRPPSPARAGTSTQVAPRVSPPRAQSPVYSSQVPKSSCGCSLKNRN